MPRSRTPGLPRTVIQLQNARHDYGKAARTEALLSRLTTSRIVDPELLAQVHDALLFLCAFPHSVRVAKLADALLAKIEADVLRIRRSGTHDDVFDDEKISGMAGTVLREEHTYEVARWLAQRYPAQVTAEWDVEELYGKLVNALPRFMPLIEDDTFVEPDIPFLKWMSTASDAEGREWLWLMKQFEAAPLSMKEKTELYDALGLTLRFNLAKCPASRTYARRPVKSLYIHRVALLQRKDVSLAAELNSPDIPLEKLDPAEATEVLNQAREALAVRHRELYGTTRADANHVYRADVGRGVEMFIWGLPPDRRLPLRAYHAGCTYKNGVPINYLEAISLFDWSEVGFNTFYTYRDGETAWIYSKILHLLHQLAGVSCISVYPYQIGFENEEAIQSGAFWFYRKMGFRPGRPDLLALTEREERKLAKDPKYRTSAKTLRKLATGHIFYEFANAPRGRYDNFSVRKIGLAVQRRMAAEFDGSIHRMRDETSGRLAKILHLDPSDLKPIERDAFNNFAYMLSLIPEVADWSAAEKSDLIDIIRAKAAPEESAYLRLLQAHQSLKRSIVKLGSASSAKTVSVALK